MKEIIMKLSQGKIGSLLAQKHSDDIFVEQCKTGSSWSAKKFFILDAWAMKKSWTKPYTYGYEIKVSKADFNQDNKWQNYLEYCNQFYFVCPYGLIKPEELPGDVGLLWVSKTGTRVYQKKKAKFRKVDIPVTLLMYILMWRAKIDVKEKSNLYDYWKSQLDIAKQSKKDGHIISSLISKNSKVIYEKNQKLEEKIEKYKELAEFIKKIKLKPDYWGSYKSSLERMIKSENLEKLKQINNEINELIYKIERNR